MKGSVDAKHLIILVVAAFMLFMLITHQAASATAVHNVVAWLRHGVGDIGRFVRNVFA